MKNEFEFINLAPSKVFVLSGPAISPPNTFVKPSTYYEVVNWCERLKNYLVKDNTGKVSWQPMSYFL